MPIVNGVPYYSQWDDDGGSNVSDCGPACVKMLLGWNEKVNKGVSVPPIDTVSIAAGLRRPGDNTHLIQLKRAAADYGLTLDIITDATLDRVKQEITVFINKENMIVRLK